MSHTRTNPAKQKPPLRTTLIIVIIMLICGLAGIVYSIVSQLMLPTDGASATPRPTDTPAFTAEDTAPAETPTATASLRVTATPFAYYTATPEGTGDPLSSPQRTPGASYNNGLKFEKELCSGNYTAGIDFPEGVYLISPVRGGGNVISSNSLDGGINVVMGDEDFRSKPDSRYEGAQSNVFLPRGTVLKIRELTVNMYSTNISANPLTPRKQTLVNTYTSLETDNLISGISFSAGTYDIIAVTGKGTVESSNSLDNGIYAYMADETIAATNSNYVPLYKNVELPVGTTLFIKGVSIKLVPST